MKNKKDSAMAIVKALARCRYYTDAAVIDGIVRVLNRARRLLRAERKGKS